MKNIRFSIPNISDSDTNLVKKVLKSGWLTHGKYTKLFEEEFKKFTRIKYAVTVSSCTAGLHLSCLASGFKKGDEVIVPAMTHTATAHAVEYTGAKAVFADIELPTGNLSLDKIISKVTKKTKGIIVVHMAGYPCEMIKIKKFCKKKKIILLEDCAHGLGTFVGDKHVGSYGLSGSFSFYPTKQITTGEGGMVLTNDRKFYNKLKVLKAFGIDKDIHERKKQGDYDVKFLGLNYRMTDFQAALGYRQLLNYKKNLKKRQLIAKRYIKNFSKTSEVAFVQFSKRCSFFVFQILIKKRDSLLKMLKKNNIGVSVHYSRSLPRMHYYKNKYKLSSKSFPNSELYANTNISLPVYPRLELSKVDYISNKIIKYLENEK